MKRWAETGGRNGSQNLNWSLRVSSALKGPVREGCVQAPRSGPERRRCHWELHTGKVCNLPCNTVAWGGTQLQLPGWIRYYTVCSSTDRHWLVLQLLSCLAFSWWEKSKNCILLNEANHTSFNTARCEVHTFLNVFSCPLLWAAAISWNISLTILTHHIYTAGSKKLEPWLCKRHREQTPSAAVS